jgi:hypothetical protein
MYSGKIAVPPGGGGIVVISAMGIVPQSLFKKFGLREHIGGLNSKRYIIILMSYREEILP